MAEKEFWEKLERLIDERIAQREPPVYEVELGKKYILLVEQKLSAEHMARLNEYFREWVANPNNPFLVLDGLNAKLVKVKSDDE